MSDIKVLSHLSANPKGLSYQELQEKTKIDATELEALVLQMHLNRQVDVLMGIRNNLPTRVIVLKKPEKTSREVLDEKENEEVKKELGET